MSNVLGNLEPKAVFGYFEEISQIPRGSGNEKGISDFLVKFAKDHNLEVIQDKAMNVIIKKPGTKGYENSPGVIIQGHMDMVCEKNSDVVHDFLKDPLKLRVVDDMVYATGTTLGADNGMAVAYGMALLASTDIPHPPLEVLVTVEEEIGLNGAAALEASNIDGKYLINIDSEEEGKLLVSCAGGVRTIHNLPVKFIDADKNLKAFKLIIKGLKGGHSGMEIDKYRGNSNKLLGRVLSSLSETLSFSVACINGGSKMNAIPRESEAIILIKGNDEAALKSVTEEWTSIFKNELKAQDPNVTVTAESYSKPITKVLDSESSAKAIASLIMIPNGIQTMSMHIKGLVESSTNLGVVETKENNILFESAVRSSVRSHKYNIVNQARTIAETLGASLEATSDYPEWEYNPDSNLRNLFIKVYKDMYNKEPEIVAIHAGVECGLFKEKMPDLDMISLGPDTLDVHTPDEHVSISSVKRTYDYILEVLKELK